MEQFSQNTQKNTEKIQEENSIEKPYIKDGIDSVFEQHPELLQIGTKEQYSHYLDTFFPESMYKEIFLHGTMSDNLFEVDDWNLNQTPDSAKSLGMGYYFAKDKDIAERYSGYGKGTLLSVILDIKNPIFTNINRNDNKGMKYAAGKKTSEIIGEGKDAIINIEYADRENYSSHNKFLEIYTGPTDEKGLPGYQDINRKVPDVTQLAVTDKSQIHILGSKKDIKKFKEYTESSGDSSAS